MIAFEELDTRELVAEIQHLGRTDTPERIAHRLGYTLEGLTKRLQREGLYGVAAPFDAVRKRSVCGHIPPRKAVTG